MLMLSMYWEDEMIKSNAQCALKNRFQTGCLGYRFCPKHCNHGSHRCWHIVFFMFMRLATLFLWWWIYMHISFMWNFYEYFLVREYETCTFLLLWSRHEKHRGTQAYLFLIFFSDDMRIWTRYDHTVVQVVAVNSVKEYRILYDVVVVW